MPARHVFGVAGLDVRPGQRVLEVGCGHGLALDLICARLGDGHAVGLDRSAPMIERARRRLAPHVAAGRVSLAQGGVEDGLEGEPFDRVLAINVPPLVRGGAAELAGLRDLLAPDGLAHLVFEPPAWESVGGREAVLERLMAALPVARLAALEVRDSGGAPVPALGVLLARVP